MDNDIQEKLAWLKEERSLSELCDKFPDEWAAMKQELIEKNRLNSVNAYLVQKLLFNRLGERKLVSLFCFHLMWPFVGQKKLLMPSVECKGIYCFYSYELVAALAQIIGQRSCLEIAAGDGTLARFLKKQGAQVIATDNKSWKHSVHYPDAVIECNAEQALIIYKPEVVICSWPPKNEQF